MSFDIGRNKVIDLRANPLGPEFLKLAPRPLK